MVVVVVVVVVMMMLLWIHNDPAVRDEITTTILSRLQRHISPHSLITTSRFGTSLPLDPVFVRSIFNTTSMPSTTLPKTTCFPSRNEVGAVVMKN